MDMAYTVEQFLDFLKEEEKSDAPYLQVSPFEVSYCKQTHTTQH